MAKLTQIEKITLLMGWKVDCYVRPHNMPPFVWAVEGEIPTDPNEDYDVIHFGPDAYPEDCLFAENHFKMTPTYLENSIIMKLTHNGETYSAEESYLQNYCKLSARMKATCNALELAYNANSKE